MVAFFTPPPFLQKVKNPPAFVNAGPEQNSGVVITLPTGRVVGNLLLLIFGQYNNSTKTPITPSGWISIGTCVALNATRYQYMQVYYRFVDGSEAATVTMSNADGFSATTWNGGICLQYSGVNSVTPVEAIGVDDSVTVNSTTFPYKQITTTVPNTLCLECLTCSQALSGGAVTGTPGSGWTERADVSQPSVYNFVACDELLVSSAGLTPSGSRTTSPLVKVVGRVAFALRPA